MPAARACSTSRLICASDGAPAATCRLLEPDAAGSLSAPPTLPLTTLALASAVEGSGSPPPEGVVDRPPARLPPAPPGEPARGLLAELAVAVWVPAAWVA